MVRGHRDSPNFIRARGRECDMLLSYFQCLPGLFYTFPENGFGVRPRYSLVLTPFKGNGLCTQDSEPKGQH